MAKYFLLGFQIIYETKYFTYCPSLKEQEERQNEMLCFRIFVKFITVDTALGILLLINQLVMCN